MAKSLLLASAMVLVLVLLNLNLVTSLRVLKACHANGYLRGKTGHCSRRNASYCCEVRKVYPRYHCSPPITGRHTRAIMAVTSFAKCGDGEDSSESDNRYQSITSLPKGGAGRSPSQSDNRFQNIAGFTKGGDGGGLFVSDNRFKNTRRFSKGGDGESPSDGNNSFKNIDSFVKDIDGSRHSVVTSFANGIDNKSDIDNSFKNIDSFAKGTDCTRFNGVSSSAKDTDDNRFSTIPNDSSAEVIVGSRYNSVVSFAKVNGGSRYDDINSFTNSTDGIRSDNISKGIDENKFGTINSFTNGRDGSGQTESNNRDDFAKGGKGRGPSKCDNRYHSDKEMVVALSTGWYNGGRRCLKNIKINANGKSVVAKVVDECDSVHGCDSDHDFQPPCPNNIVKASPMVWEALDIPKSKVGNYHITWSI